MMSELSLNVLDLARNSISAGAALVEIEIEENNAKDKLTLQVKDNGSGMSEEVRKSVENPFVTMRTTRKTGLGIPFFRQAAEMTGGCMSIDSKLGEGTTISATFMMSHIDRRPMGDLTGTMVALIALNADIDFKLRYIIDQNEFIFATQEIREILGEEVPLSSPAVLEFLAEYLNENISSL
jgi:hypothetical protein